MSICAIGIAIGCGAIALVVHEFVLFLVDRVQVKNLQKLMEMEADHEN